ncbi:uncharacterized protein B0H18DRAFT_1113695 [Fomitopsis serialis]|uniref:uncharacterized protein n=1 Tax=Fomitopsis serialis TaxID=139415 RepID=UPI0020085577|nr:uncharacterized protein B0H18DRAFT_1113695 [Neoantrodia serialis]KAH9936280.1 hypothetical protein B0H18DRAFT_1113695 [Neoantrodia serialis]
MVLREAVRHALQGGRAFSTSASRGVVYVSNIGKQPIRYPPTVSFTQSPAALSVQGPLGTTSEPSEKKQRSMWGLTRTLIQNAIIGMTEGFTTPVYLTEGMSGQRLNMKLGFSHAVYVPVPEYIKVELLGLFAAKIRRWRPPEPYKGKGVFVGDERVRMKAIKKK